MKKISILLISILFLAACGIKGDITGKTFNMKLMGSEETVTFTKDGIAHPTDDPSDKEVRYQIKDDTLILKQDENNHMEIELEKKGDGFFEGEVKKLFIDGKEQTDELKSLDESDENVVTLTQVK
ncbi:hypothetical protein GTN31_02730 [Macrococcoides canis]|uniref:lipoprotein n=1 Tax=Macrococcoides canis TaxID=1855823 RepID=UPI0013E98C2B|nr:hypothetical protein [Macrococcus canis]QIH75254.1 hypothetical protein GTN31_02730 [Macrococcus canis]